MNLLVNFTLFRFVVSASFAIAAFSAPLFSVTHYVNSTGGDDSAAINAAISLASAGDTIYLNAGTFNIGSTLSAKTGVAIVGAGKASTAIQFTGGAGTPMVNIGGNNNIEIANLTLNGNNTSGHAINGWVGSGYFIHDTAIKNLGADSVGILFSQSVTDSKISNNEISNIGVGSDWGGGVRMAWGSSRNQVLNNTISNTGRGGIFANDGSTDLVIRNNTVTGSGNNPGGTGLGIEIWNGCDRSVIQGNTVDQWLSVDRSNRVAVRSNVVTSTGVIGLELAGGVDNVYSHNTVMPGSGVGISASGATDKKRILLSYNTIKGATIWGAQIQPDAVRGVEQLYFYKNTFEGTTGGHPQGGHGFRFNLNVGSLPEALDNLQNVILDSNTFTNNYALGLTGADWTGKLTVINNKITNNGAQGISMNADGPKFGPDLKWQNNTVTGNHGVGANFQPTSKGTFLNGAPTVSITAPTTVTVGESVDFGLEYLGVAPLANVLWDLGDGLPMVTSGTSFIYTKPGTYLVSLVVWDTLGRGAYGEIEVAVTAAIPEPSALLMIGMMALMPQRRWRQALTRRLPATSHR